MDHPTRTAPPEAPAGQAPLGVPPALDRSAAAAPACSNCGATLTGPYCAQCGQEAAHRMVSLGRIVEDALEDQLSLNAALPRTLSALLLHPGRLTREFVAGRIRSYLPPMRVYLVCSVLFFLVLAYRDNPEQLAHNAPASTVRISDAPPAIARVSVARDAKGAAALPPSFISIDTSHGPTWLRQRLKAQAQRVEHMSPRDAAQQILAGLFTAAPKVAFVLLPLFAALLKLLYIRRRRLYIEHFVFALHTHAVAFLAFTAMLLAPYFVVKALLCAWLVFYFFHALRVVYGQGWLKTVVKMGALAFMYFFVLVFALTGAALFALLSI
jgi:hypothetical protein